MRAMVLAWCVIFSGCASIAPVTDFDGRAIQPLSPAAGRCHVLIFTTVDCPIANSYAAEIGRLHAEFEPRGGKFFLVHVDRELTADQARKHAVEYSLKMQMMIDRDRSLVDTVGAKTTPEAAVIIGGGKVIYHGRIDDRYADYGLQRSAPTRHELRDAIEAALAGRLPAVDHVPALGCTIPR